MYVKGLERGAAEEQSLYLANANYVAAFEPELRGRMNTQSRL